MPEQGFPLPGSSYKELIKIIQAYGQLGQEAAIGEVAKVIAVHDTIVSRNNRFLVAVGIVQGSKKKSITPIGGELAAALQYGMEDEIGSKWRTIVDSNDFLQRVVAAVRIRRGMDESGLQVHIAYSAGQPKTQNVLTGASTIVEILKIAGLLKEEGGNLVAVALEPAKTLGVREQPASPPQVPLPSGVLPLRVETSAAGAVQVHIEVRIQCTPQDLDELGQKLRKMLDDFQQQAKTGHAPVTGEESQ